MTFKEKLIISATNYSRLKLNIDENFWVLISDKEHFLSENHSGLYDKEHFLIRFNKEWIKNASFKKIIECAFHEVFHAFQHQEILKRKLGYKSLYFNNDELDQIEKEFYDENYNIDDWSQYLIEEQAEYFSVYLSNIFLGKYKYDNNFINKYLNLFKNIE